MGSIPGWGPKVHKPHGAQSLWIPKPGLIPFPGNLAAWGGLPWGVGETQG